ncbi:RnfABCDGE type electron transport complex subunit B [bacterium]|nr:RnfABCDGE type electron transport complex subunit B [candidate division CSSED10-310 bacterium]
MDVIYITVICLGAIALVAGIVLFVASKKFAVIENPLIDEVEELLPGANCGGCGFAGCRAFAEAFVTTKNTELKCPPGGPAVMEAIAAKVGIAVKDHVRIVARIRCQGGSNSVRAGEYHGIRTCAAAQIGNNVDLVCPYGCIGYGDCIRACPFDAIRSIDGIAVVDENKCVGCGVCVRACPRNLIELTRYDKRVYVACNSPDKGPQVKKYCSVGCIGCKMCERACQFEAIAFKPFLAAVKPDQCTECLACVDKCPPKTILFRGDDAFAVKPAEPGSVSIDRESTVSA